MEMTIVGLAGCLVVAVVLIVLLIADKMEAERQRDYWHEKADSYYRSKEAYWKLLAEKNDEDAHKDYEAMRDGIIKEIGGRLNESWGKKND